MKYTPDLVTLDYVRQLQSLAKGSAIQDTDNVNNILQAYIHEASSEMIAALQRVPMPYVDTRTFDYGGVEMVDAYDLRVHVDLCEVTALINAGDTVAPSAYVLRPANEFPKDCIRLKRFGSVTWDYETDIEDAVSVNGVWGYVPHYNTCWRDSGQTVPAGELTNEGDTTLMLSGVDLGIDRLVYLKINDEYLQVTGRSEDTNTTLTLSRGEIGTIATAHSEGDVIYYFEQHPDIKGATAEVVRYKYKTRDEFGGQVRFTDGSTFTVERVAESVATTIRKHRKYTFWAA